MAGMVFVSDDSRWGVDSWAFSWAVETLAEHVTVAPLAARLREIEEHHLGSLALADFPPDQRADLVAQIRRLPQIADETLGQSDSRDSFIAKIQDLADLVAAAEA